MRIVVDTNVLVSGMHWGGIPAEVVKAWANGRIEVVCSAEIIREYSEVLHRINREMPPDKLDGMLSFLISQSEIVQPNHWFKIILEDPGDDKFIDCAFHAQANMIISGDKHLLKLEKFGPILILSPSEFKKKFRRLFC
ncbi:MAG: putative toxin-antitoxin system toxin component, PIN family [Acidobacteriota bacterium]|nr:putative toxin-antitoxin system toxin component, PIN family [Acidobacteriota bacterium]